jgi:hypothetical protein
VYYNSALTPWGYNPTARRSRISPDGDLLFQGDDAGLIDRGGYAGSGKAGLKQFYLYDADTGRLACVSCNPSGEAPKNVPQLTVSYEAGTSGSTPHDPYALSDDGRYVFFSTPEPLVDEDTNNTWDAYEYDSKTRENHLLSTGTSSAGSYLIDATTDGSEAFFVTRQRLSGWDIDVLYDMYVARVNGGLPEPAPVTAPCEGESCLPSAIPGPARAATGSEAAGAGNPPRKCPKGTRRVRRKGAVRCVRKHRHHSRKHRRAATTDRRAGK